MSVIGRLWHRAPAWRLCGTVALACTALAAMFPPALPRWPRGAAPAAVSGDAPTPATASPAGGTSPGGAAFAGTARYVPQPDPAPLSYSTVSTPPLAPGRTGLVPEAGRMMPLPAGAWQTLAFARGSGPMATQVSLLDRVEDGLLTGLLIAAAPPPVGRVSGPATAPLPCVAPNVLARQVRPQPAADPYAHECWTIVASAMTGPDGAGSHDELLKIGLDRLEKLHVAVPDRMLVVRLVRSDETGWMLATLFLPDRRGTSPGALHRLEEWAGRFEALFHKGYDGTLAAGEATGAAARDPQG